MFKLTLRSPCSATGRPLLMRWNAAGGRDRSRDRKSARRQGVLLHHHHRPVGPVDERPRFPREYLKLLDREFAEQFALLIQLMGPATLDTSSLVAFTFIPSIVLSQYCSVCWQLRCTNRQQER